MTPVQRLDVWLDGLSEPAGKLTKFEDQSISFSYSEALLASDLHPLSLSLPLTSEPLADADTRAFFGNLLPENDQMQKKMDQERLDRNDLVGILAFVGADCAGAISCLPEGSPQAKVPGVLAEDYRRLEPEELGEIAISLAEKQRLPDNVDDPSPVAGVQRKIALVRLEDGAFALPVAGLHVPTTHILKVPSRQDASDVILETAAAQLAAAVGLDVAIPEPLDIAGTPALLIERYDRVVQDGVVYRRHQEDFAQALGLPPLLKYERNGTENHRFDLAGILSLLDRIANPALARRDFLLTTLFNLAIGNTDNHAKNHALLYAGSSIPALAPLYDLLPIRLSDQYHHNFSFKIGAADCLDALTRDDLLVLFAVFGFEGRRLDRLLNRDIARMFTALDREAGTLPRPQLKNFDDLIGRELGVLTELLGLRIPLRERDAYMGRGGGWPSS